LALSDMSVCGVVNLVSCNEVVFTSKQLDVFGTSKSLLQMLDPQPFMQLPQEPPSEKAISGQKLEAPAGKAQGKNNP
jgi:hypothetical protein